MSRVITRQTQPLADLVLHHSLSVASLLLSLFNIRASKQNQASYFSALIILCLPTMVALTLTHTHLKLAFLFSCSLFALNFSSISIHALNIGVQTTGSAVSVSKECSRKCESEFCSVPPFLRYGKYCGLLYSGCPGEKPCDGLDACCMKHDNCVAAKNNDYLSQECSQNFLNCMANFKNSGGPTFKGNKCQVDEVIDVISLVIEAALLAGRYLQKP